MSFTRLIIGALTCAAALASPYTGKDMRVYSRNPNLAPRDVIREIGHSLALVSRQNPNAVFSNSTSIAKSWDGATLLNIEVEGTVDEDRNSETEVSFGIEIKCTTCYLTGDILAELYVSQNFDFAQTFDNFTEQIGAAVENTTDAVGTIITDYIPNVVRNFADGIDLDDFDLPPLDVEFNIDIPEIPEVQLNFQFDNLELYVELETTFSGGITYTLNLYTSQTPIGIQVENIFLGIVASVDLILSAEAEITITSGFHIKLDDGARLQLGLFASEVANTDFQGGQFEFLPVTIESAGVVLQAVLRFKVRAGFELSTPDIEIAGINIFTASAGVEVSLWTNLAELTTNVTITPAGDEEGCQFQVVEEYKFGVGAGAGATVAVNDHVWGPTPSTTIDLFTTALTQCALSRATTATPAVTSVAKIKGRQADQADLTETTISTEVTYRAVQCLSTGMIDCPASLQKTTKTSSEITLVTFVRSGVEATFPATTAMTVGDTKPFGTAAAKLFETAGAPKPYIEGESEIKRKGGSFLDGDINGVSKRLIFGVSLGGGLFVLLLIGIGIFIWWRKRVYRNVPTTEGRPQIVSYQSEPYKPGMAYDTMQHPGYTGNVRTTTTEFR